MNTPTIVNISNFDINRVTFVKVPSTKANRSPTINIKYDGQNFQLRLPSRMNTRLFEKMDENKGEISYKLSTNLTNCDPWGKERASGETDCEKLYNLVVFDLKEKILAAAEKNSIEWFGKQRSKEGLSESFTDMYMLSSTKEGNIYVPNGKYSPSFRIKVPIYNNKVSASVVDAGRNDVSVTPDTLKNTFQPNTEVNMVVSPSIYTMNGGGFGVTFKLSYAQVFPKSRITAASIFADEEPATQTQNTNIEEYLDDQPEEEQVTTTPPRPVTPPQLPAAPARKKRSAA